jgi:hypothetical protein
MKVLGPMMAVVGLVWFVGCTERESSSPTAPSVHGPQAVSPVAGQFIQYSPQQSAQLLAGGLAPKSERIKAALGGTVTNGGFTVRIPAFALPADTTVTITPTSAFVMTCDIQPSGLQFSPNIPVTLAFDYRGTTADPLSPNYIPGPVTAVWFNPSISSWMVIGGTDYPIQREFDSTLGHFSYYALAK